MMDAQAARAALLEVRTRFDDAAKRIVEELNKRDDRTQEAVSLAAEDARANVMGEVVHIEAAADRCVAALEQWEIREATPLQDDQSFMDALRTLLREVADFNGEGQSEDHI